MNIYKCENTDCGHFFKSNNPECCPKCNSLEFSSHHKKSRKKFIIIGCLILLIGASLFYIQRNNNLNKENNLLCIKKQTELAAKGYLSINKIDGFCDSPITQNAERLQLEDDKKHKEIDNLKNLGWKEDGVENPFEFIKDKYIVWEYNTIYDLTEIPDSKVTDYIIDKKVINFHNNTKVTLYKNNIKKSQQVENEIEWVNQKLENHGEKIKKPYFSYTRQNKDDIKFEINGKTIGFFTVIEKEDTYNASIYNNSTQTYKEKSLTAADYFSKADAYRKSENYEDALINYNKAISIDSKNSRYYFGKGLSLYYLEELNQAQSSFSKAIQLGSNNANAYCWRAYCRSKIGGWAKSSLINDCTEAINIDPENGWAYHYRGNWKKESGNYSSSNYKRDYRKACQLGQDCCDKY